MDRSTIGWMPVASEGYVTTDSDFLGDAADLDRNIRKLLIAAQLSPDERQEFACLFREGAKFLHWSTGWIVFRLHRLAEERTTSAPSTS
jgi:hypothetical protein